MAGWKKLPNAKPIINITIDEDLLKKIEDLRFEMRLANRSQTVSYLIEEGLRAFETKIPKFVSFDEAMEEYQKGKLIESYLDEDLTGPYAGYKKGSHVKEISIEEILEGKWVIVEQ
ncbi:tRNA U34 5-carboxymethylaminomethyl modifying GTPase MnmE/TrmE [Neobacillus sp. B4I6]|uniref:ribbon-helix-helix domain-containing protein n=1 Tax=Neobacillus sp. B4I6 TaxID=3373925 RepID=UPI003D2563DE